MSSHGTVVPSLVQCCVSKMLEAVANAKTDQEIAKLPAILSLSWERKKHCRRLKPDTQFHDPIGFGPTISFLAFACTYGTPELVKHLVEKHRGKLDIECFKRAIDCNADPAVARYIGSVLGPDVIDSDADCTPLQKACMDLNEGAVQRLLEVGADANKAAGKTHLRPWSPF